MPATPALVHCASFAKWAAPAPVVEYLAPACVRHTGAFGVLRTCFCSQHIHQWRRGVLRAGSPAPAVIAALAALVHYSASAAAALAGSSSWGDRSTNSRCGVHRTGSCKRVHRASTYRVRVASACGRIHRTSVIMRGTGFIWVRRASVSAGVHCSSVSVIAASAPVVEYVAPAPSRTLRGASPGRVRAAPRQLWSTPRQCLPRS